MRTNHAALSAHAWVHGRELARQAYVWFGLNNLGSHSTYNENIASWIKTENIVGLEGLKLNN